MYKVKNVINWNKYFIIGFHGVQYFIYNYPSPKM